VSDIEQHGIADTGKLKAPSHRQRLCNRAYSRSVRSIRNCFYPQGKIMIFKMIVIR